MRLIQSRIDLSIGHYLDTYTSIVSACRYATRKKDQKSCDLANQADSIH